MANEFIGISYDAFRSNFTRLARPYKLNFAITMWCQSRCLTCNIWELKPKDELRLDEIQQFAKNNNSFRWVGLTGGEPFLRSDIVEIAKAFKENSKGLYLLTIPTNSLCNQDKEIAKIREMLELRIPNVVITVSLDGNREMHDRVRGIPGNYEKAITMFKRLKELKKEHSNLSMVFGYTISRINQGTLESTYTDVKKDIPDITYNDFHINLAQKSDNYYHNADTAILADRSIAANDMKNVLNNMKSDSRLMQSVETKFLNGLINFTKSGVPPLKCRSLDASLFMDSWGNVFPSIMWNYKIANIRDNAYSLDNIWHNEFAENARKMIKEGKDPKHWTSCEAYQSILGSMLKPSFAQKAQSVTVQESVPKVEMKTEITNQ